jgi:methylenetetrahydrofolate dehydrogenase (NADP+)/methenyltetrahydrofolate cyclohydrolase
MSAALLDGKKVADQIIEEVRGESASLAQKGVRPGLGVLLVGDNAASAIYVRSKTRTCEDLGIYHDTHTLPVTATTAEVISKVEGFNARPDIHGILIQLPLPPQIDTQRVLRAADPAKDVDGFHPENVGLLVQKQPRFVPCTPAGIMELLSRSSIPVASRRTVVIGRSDIVGKPLALLLLHADATVTICHSRSRDLASVTREADLLVAAIGRAGFVRPEHVKEGAVVVDVGMNRITNPLEAEELLEGERLVAFHKKGHAVVGDVHFRSVREKASFITPVPGGVGPLTIALLMKNTVKAARLQT